MSRSKSNKLSSSYSNIFSKCNTFNDFFPFFFHNVECFVSIYLYWIRNIFKAISWYFISRISTELWCLTIILCAHFKLQRHRIFKQSFNLFYLFNKRFVLFLFLQVWRQLILQVNAHCCCIRNLTVEKIQLYQ